MIPTKRVQWTLDIHYHLRSVNKNFELLFDADIGMSLSAAYFSSLVASFIF